MGLKRRSSKKEGRLGVGRGAEGGDCMIIEAS